MFYYTLLHSLSLYNYIYIYVYVYVYLVTRINCKLLTRCLGSSISTCATSRDITPPKMAGKVKYDAEIKKMCKQASGYANWDLTMKNKD